MIQKPLTFAALIRVSTEQQEKYGESLRTQKEEIIKQVESLKGRVVKWYGGQEHATPGHEKKEIDRLLHDAIAGDFDAVIVTDADRWSRDNAKSMAGLEIFKQKRIRFFVGGTEHDLFKPECSLFLGMSAVIGQYHAANQSRKSMLNRLNRAKRGIPTAGKLPFGRTFDSATEKWGIDPEKKAMIEDIAQRYLAGENLGKLADEYSVNHASLHKTLMHRCGSEWQVRFNSKDHNIHETATIAIPPLLPESMITAVKVHCQSHRTFCRQQRKNKYLLSGFVLCNRCGYALFGQTNRNQRRYYRHAHTKRCRPCPGPHAWIDADVLENNVFWHLFDCFGNPFAVEKAIENAIPDRDKAIALSKQCERLERSIAQINTARERLVKFVSRGKLQDSDAESELDRLQTKETRQREQIKRVRDYLDNVPNKKAIKRITDYLASGHLGPWLITKQRIANHSPDRMSWEDRRELILKVFNGKQLDGRRMGVSIDWADSKGNQRQFAWNYSISGHLIEETDQSPIDAERAEIIFPGSGGYLQKKLVTLSASH